MWQQKLPKSTPHHYFSNTTSSHGGAWFVGELVRGETRQRCLVLQVLFELPGFDESYQTYSTVIGWDGNQVQRPIERCKMLGRRPNIADEPWPWWINQLQQWAPFLTSFNHLNLLPLRCHKVQLAFCLGVYSWEDGCGERSYHTTSLVRSPLDAATAAKGYWKFRTVHQNSVEKQMTPDRKSVV